MKSLIYYICTMATEQELRDGAEKNLEACKNQLEMIQNPSPVFIVACTTLSLGILYVMFLIFMAASPAGIWIDSDKSRYKIESSWITGKVRIMKIVSDEAHPFKEGTLRGAALTVSDPDGVMSGVWTETQIIWIDLAGTPKLWNKEIPLR